MWVGGQAELPRVINGGPETSEDVNHATNCASLILDASSRQENENLYLLPSVL